MPTTCNNTKKNLIFQEFLLLLGHLVHSDLMRQIDYLKVENQEMVEVFNLAFTY